MCPACLTTAALLAAGTVWTGGLTAGLVRWRRHPGAVIPLRSAPPAAPDGPTDTRDATESRAGAPAAAPPDARGESR